MKLIEADLVMNASRHLLDCHSLVRWIVSSLCSARLHEESRTLLRLKEMEEGHSIRKENITFKEYRITTVSSAKCQATSIVSSLLKESFLFYSLNIIVN